MFDQPIGNVKLSQCVSFDGVKYDLTFDARQGEIMEIQLRSCIITEL